MIKKYTKKPVTIEAAQYDGTDECINQMVAGFGNTFVLAACLHKDTRELELCTLEGWMTASVGDMIIRGVEGEFYACKPSVFKKSYEEAI